jgi:probable rRNA maturation factor
MIETEVLDEGWSPAIDWEALAARAVSAAIKITPYASLNDAKVTFEIAVRLTTDAEVYGLNKMYRDKDQATNILSFPMFGAAELAGLLESRDPLVLLGDLALAKETCQAEALAKEITLDAHVTHLIVHGVLHLLGYDHMGDADADAMEDLERKALATLGFADPYGD